MARHKHYECIVAWAEGKKIQCRPRNFEQWREPSNPADPSWSEQMEYRVAPEKKKGFMIVHIIKGAPRVASIFDTLEQAKKFAADGATITPVEWEE